MKWIVLGLFAVIICFVLVILGFIKFFPLYIATPLLFGSIYFTVSRLFSPSNSNTTFKGFNSMH